MTLRWARSATECQPLLNQREYFVMTDLDKLSQDIFVPGKPPEQFRYPGINERRVFADGMVIDYDLAVPMRDGIIIRADLYRPDTGDAALPTLILWSPYGKHGPVTWELFEGSEVEVEKLSAHTLVECPDPVLWCGHGYAIPAVDPRGTWGSEGDFSIQSPQERQDMYDTIEWAAQQSWSTGRIGMAGMSYFGWSQWQAASTKPPHLAAILPYDGLTDAYRELAFHGGIPNNQFMRTWGAKKTMWGKNKVEDWLKAIKAHPLLDEFWRSKQPDLEQIDVPIYVVASWTDHGIHTRGSIEGFRRISSPNKYLEVHGRKKWARYYWDESVARQVAFFDRYLKDERNEVDDWPKVRIEVRDAFYSGQWRNENEWPLARTQYVRLHLDAASKSANEALPATEALVSYQSQDAQIHATFTHTFANETELTGYSKLKLWISTDSSDDADLFVAVQKLDVDGAVVNFPYFTLQNDGQATHGWQRVSHRELDEHRSTPQQPVHLHQREQRLAPGEIVEVEIELWPSSTLYRAGESLRILVKGTDIQSYPPDTFVAGHASDRNKGVHRLHTGGRFDSHLLIPVVPAPVQGSVGAAFPHTAPTPGINAARRPW
jgi:predicted acyl esterase